MRGKLQPADAGFRGLGMPRTRSGVRHHDAAKHVVTPANAGVQNLIAKKP